jgi:hypothetical protein
VNARASPRNCASKLATEAKRVDRAAARFEVGAGVKGRSGARFGLGAVKHTRHYIVRLLREPGNVSSKAICIWLVHKRRQVTAARKVAIQVFLANKRFD